MLVHRLGGTAGEVNNAIVSVQDAPCHKPRFNNCQSFDTVHQQMSCTTFPTDVPQSDMTELQCDLTEAPSEALSEFQRERRHHPTVTLWGHHPPVSQYTV